MQFNTRTAMLKGLELRRKLGSWDAVVNRDRAVDDTIDVVRPSFDDEPRTEPSAAATE
jgi:hypothetical protein